MIGDTYLSNEGYIITIVDYITRHKVMIKFHNGYKTWTTMQNIKKGQVKNPYHKSVYSIGYYGDGNYNSRINGVKTKQYIKWFSMFNRCYDSKYHEKQPTYIGCSVHEDFHNFQDFAEWYDMKVYDCEYELELDKDLLIENNKVYSPSTCCFLPKEINNALKYKRNDKEYMTSIYKKYSDNLPQYIRFKLLELTTYESKVR